MLIDAIVFDNEYAMLDFRMRILAPVVDFFVVVEGDRTFSGTPKPFTSEEFWRDKFGDYAGTLITVKVRLPMYDGSAPSAWTREGAQRNAILYGVPEAKPSDLIILSDVDEIPSREAIAQVKANSLTLPMGCEQQILFYDMWSRREEYGSSLWRGSVFSTVGQMRHWSPQGLRCQREGWRSIPNGGWHFTSFGGVEQVRHKLQSFSHVECNRPEFTSDENLREAIRLGKDPCGFHDVKTFPVGPDFYPDYVLEAAQAVGWMERVPA